MERDPVDRTTPSEDGRTSVEPTLALLAGLELEPPEGFVDRVVLAAGRRGRRRLAMTRAAGLGGWARRAGGTRRRAVASSALLAGAVALGLEARHLRRTREMRAA
jgi:hypothetical protein